MIYAHSTEAWWSSQAKNILELLLERLINDLLQAVIIKFHHFKIILKILLCLEIANTGVQSCHVREWKPEAYCVKWLGFKMLNADSEKSILIFQNSLRPLLLKNTENMHLSKMVKTAKPISKSLYTDKTRRGKKERKYLPRMFFCLFFGLFFCHNY